MSDYDVVAGLPHVCPNCGAGMVRPGKLEERLAEAEAAADHVSFENEVDMQRLEQQLATAHGLLREACEDGFAHGDWIGWIERAMKECGG